MDRDGTYILSATKTPDRRPSDLTKIKAVKGALGEFMVSESRAVHVHSDGVIGIAGFSWSEFSWPDKSRGRINEEDR